MSSKQHAANAKLSISYKDPATLTPYANNAREHTPAQVQMIAASIKQFGFNAPVLIDEEKSIIAGHGRVLAALELALSKVPTITLKYLSEFERRLYIIADNRLAETGSSWDYTLLEAELRAVEMELGDVTLTGFTPDQLNLEPPDTSSPLPSQSGEIDMNNLDTEYECPSCGFEFC